MSENVEQCLVLCPEPKYIQFIFTQDKEKQQVVTFEELEPEDFGIFAFLKWYKQLICCVQLEQSLKTMRRREAEGSLNVLMPRQRVFWFVHVTEAVSCFLHTSFTKWRKNWSSLRELASHFCTVELRQEIHERVNPTRPVFSQHQEFVMESHSWAVRGWRRRF